MSHDGQVISICPACGATFWQDVSPFCPHTDAPGSMRVQIVQMPKQPEPSVLKPKPRNLITLVFIINGVDVPVECDTETDTMGDAMLRAHAARSVCGPRILARDEHGVTMPPRQKLWRLHFRDGTRLFLLPTNATGYLDDEQSIPTPPAPGGSK